MYTARSFLKSKSLLLATLLLMALVTLALAGCGAGQSSSNATAENTPSQTEPATPKDEPESQDADQGADGAASSNDAADQAPKIDERYVGGWTAVSILGRNEDGSIKEGALSEMGIEYFQVSIDEHGFISESARNQNGDDLLVTYLLKYDEELHGYRAYSSDGKHRGNLMVVPREGDAPDEMLYDMIVDEHALAFRMVKQ